MRNLCFLIFFCPFYVFCQTVSTVSEQFNGSGGISLTQDGTILVADFGQGLSNPNGTVINAFDADFNRTVFASGFSGASGNVIAPDGTIYQGNIGANRISKVTPEGNVSTYATLGVSAPVGVVLDSEGNLYVANCGNHTVQKISNNGQQSTLFSSSALLACPNGITIDANGFIYVSNFNNGNIIKLDPEGNASVFATLPGSNNGHITYCEVTNYFYAASHGSSRIYRISPAGEVVIIAGSGVRGNADGDASQAQFSRPNGIRATVTGDTLFVNSSVPTTNVGFPLNPSLLRMITGVNERITDIDKHEAAVNIRVSPNPIQDKIHLHFEDFKKQQYQAQLFNTQFQLVGVFEGINSNSKILSFPEDLSSGLYYLSVTTEGQSQTILKIVKE